MPVSILVSRPAGPKHLARRDNFFHEANRQPSDRGCARNETDSARSGYFYCPGFRELSELIFLRA